MNQANQKAVLIRLALILMLLAVGCGAESSENASEKTGDDPGKPVRVVEASSETLHRRIQAIGTLRSSETVGIASKVVGRVRRVAFEPGQRVDRGRTLFVLDSAQLEKRRQSAAAALSQARSRLETVAKNHQRMKELWSKDAISTQRYDQAKGDYQAARAEVRRLEAKLAVAEERLGETTIVAPMAGAITESRVDPGDLVRVGQKLAELHADDPLEIRFTVPEDRMNEVEKGQPVTLTVSAYPDRTFSGRIFYISPSIRASTRDFTVKASVDNTDHRLKPGLFAEVRVTVEVLENRPVIPEEALVAGREGYSVFVVRDGRAHERGVQPGLRRLGRVEIADGLEVGERVVRQGQMDLTDGDAVRVVDDGDGVE
jgi:membrane fusion protein (multidrug efflux system)